MKTRIITACLCLPLLLAVLIISKPWLLTAVVILMALIGLWEMLHALNLFTKTPLVILSCWMGVLLPLLAWLCADLIWPAVIAYTMAVLLLSVVCHKTISFSNVAKFYFATLYVAGLFSTIVTVRMEACGHLLLWLIFLAAFSTDTFAYFVGLLLGRHKLCPEISPKKTIEGAIGGVLGCQLCFLLFDFIIIKSNTPAVVNMPSFMLLALVSSILSQFGDLSASIIKRQVGVKDYGNLFPGHGGILDRFDSVLFTAPVIAIWSQIWTIFIA